MSNQHESFWDDVSYDCRQICDIPKSVVLRIWHDGDKVCAKVSAQGTYRPGIFCHVRTADWSETVTARYESQTGLRVASQAAYQWWLAASIAEHYADTLKAHLDGDADREPAPEIELAHTEALMFTEMDFLREEAEALYDLWKWQQLMNAFDEARKKAQG